ncbi:MAG: hypothetical protein DI539_14910 [Flavobacterium psychrophilum]|nr:MAG: hypothetical protein DI539_14910 [Flavobacterium psychrophilum]
MRLLLIFTGLLLCMTMQGQTYAPYSVGKSKTTKTVVSKPDSTANKDTKPVVVEKAPEKKNAQPKTAVSKPDATKTESSKLVVAEKTPEKENAKPKESSRDFMTMAIEQLHQKNYQKAIDFYTLALEVSTPEYAHIVLKSRAILYAIMKEDEKAVADLTSAIQYKGTPETQLAILYVMRAKMYANNKNMDLACKDVTKAKSLGALQEQIRDIDCK